MFVACYACCCCMAHFTGDSTPAAAPPPADLNGDKGEVESAFQASTRETTRAPCPPLGSEAVSAKLGFASRDGISEWAESAEPFKPQLTRPSARDAQPDARVKLEESGEAEANAIERLQAAQAMETPSTQDYAVGGQAQRFVPNPAALLRVARRPREG